MPNNNPLAAALFGLLSAACWGTGDFAGGLATKKSSPYFVVLLSQLVGVILLTVLAWFIDELPPHPTDLIW